MSNRLLPKTLYWREIIPKTWGKIYTVTWSHWWKSAIIKQKKNEILDSFFCFFLSVNKEGWTKHQNCWQNRLHLKSYETLRGENMN